jgi:membrane protein implicated in regulation of membrane protease activity
MSEFMDWLSSHQPEAWLGLAMVLGLAEMFSLDLILAMLAAGALVGMLAAIIGFPFAVQVVAGAAASVALLALLRPSLVKRLHNGPELMTGHAKLVGREAFVTVAMSQHQPGRIKLAGEIWTAEPYDESLVIEEGETVQVLQIRGATAFVTPVPKLES